MGSDDMKDVKIVMELIEDFISNLTASLDTFSSYVFSTIFFFFFVFFLIL